MLSLNWENWYFVDVCETNGSLVDILTFKKKVVLCVNKKVPRIPSWHSDNGATEL